MKISTVWKWRDLFLGRNGRARDVPKALIWANKTDHPDARYIARIFKDYSGSLMDTLEQHIDDLTAPKGLIRYFIWYVTPLHSIVYLRMSAELGYAAAQYEMFSPENRALAAEQNDPDALFSVGRTQEAEKFGCLQAIYTLHVQTKLEDDFEYFYYAYKLAKRNFLAYNYLYHIVEYMNNHSFDCISYFACSKMKKWNRSFDPHKVPTHLARFDQFCQSVKDKVANWSRFAKRVGLCRDVRIYVGKLIWNNKFVKT